MAENEARRKRLEIENIQFKEKLEEMTEMFVNKTELKRKEMEKREEAIRSNLEKNALVRERAFKMKGQRHQGKIEKAIEVSENKLNEIKQDLLKRKEKAEYNLRKFKNKQEEEHNRKLMVAKEKDEKIKRMLVTK